MASDYIRFDWAMKRLLRQKANFVVLEGLLTVLLNEEIHIVEILESESNQDSSDDKFNRVDIKAKNHKGEIIIVEIQNTRELTYMERILYGVSKAITEHIHLGDSYEVVKKVYSISILYFDIGEGSDYLYHGRTHFVGVHTGDQLIVSTKQRDAIVPRPSDDIFPEYYLIRVNEFNKVAVTPLEEWISYLKTGEIPTDATAPGLPEARERMRYYDMTDKEKHSYVGYLDHIRTQNNFVDSYRLEINIAQQKVEEQKQKVEEEKKRAEEEKKRADEAERKADEAERKADEEKRKADEEKRKADEEKRKADEEKRKADEAERKADEAERKANEAKSNLIARLRQLGYSIEEMMSITGLSREELQ
ncbi:MAG: PD-(D/E)XK nuclease family transposase [Mediterranea sp.]|jgi:flagellar biosynthesis GTPase FlhF|nr:PD-(D/E)XK nuclease family transposase [Mediterranea sp.]